jgi:hypothetical protein
VLGSSVPGTEVPGSKKRRLYSRACHGPAGDRTVTSQCPAKTLSPTWGKSGGGVSERAGTKAGGSNPFARTIPSCVVAVKGILVFWKAALFAGRRRNEGLGRSVRSRGVLPRQQRADDSGCPENAEEGNVVSMRHKVHAPDAGTRNRRKRQGMRPSLGSSTRAR